MYFFHISFQKYISGALRLKTRKEGLNNNCFQRRFPCLPPCWVPCKPYASIDVMVASTQVGQAFFTVCPLLPLVGRALDFISNASNHYI